MGMGVHHHKRFMHAGIAVRKGIAKRQTMYSPGGKRVGLPAGPAHSEDLEDHQGAAASASPSRQTSISSPGVSVLTGSRARGSASGPQQQDAADGAELPAEPVQLAMPATGGLSGTRKPSGRGMATAGTLPPLFI